MDKDYNEGPADVVKMPSSSTSPFIEKTPQQCHALLKEIRNTTKSEKIDPYYFGILDERSMDDGTVLVVNGKDGYGSVRAEFAMAIPAMQCWMTGHSSVEEDIERAQNSQDNVLRWSTLNEDASGNNQ